MGKIIPFWEGGTGVQIRKKTNKHISLSRIMASFHTIFYNVNVVHVKSENTL